jgi:hypothetical protein
MTALSLVLMFAAGYLLGRFLPPQFWRRQKPAKRSRALPKGTSGPGKPGRPRKATDAQPAQPDPGPALPMD